MILRALITFITLLTLTTSAQAQIIKLSISGRLTDDNFRVSNAFDDVAAIGDAFKLIMRWDDSAPGNFGVNGGYAFGNWSNMGETSFRVNGHSFDLSANGGSVGVGYDFDRDEPETYVFNEYYESTEFARNPGNASSTLGDRVTDLGVRFEIWNYTASLLTDPNVVGLADVIQDVLDFDSNGGPSGFRGRFELEDANERDSLTLDLSSRHVSDLYFALEVPAPAGVPLLGMALFAAGLATRRRPSLGTASAAS